jgi:uncharacterized protein (TIGR02611 family)
MTERPSSERREPKVVRGLRERRETHKDRGRIYRAAFLLAGLVFTLSGVAMLVLPGPAFVVIPVGLAILSLEFAWAGRLLDHALDKAQTAQEKAAATSTRQKLMSLIAIAGAAIGFVAAAIRYDIPLLPV